MKRRQRRHLNEQIEIFTASIADINKALALKKKTDLRITLPNYLQDYINIFDPIEADKLPER
jgi:hypothetical protein